MKQLIINFCENWNRETQLISYQVQVEEKPPWKLRQVVVFSNSSRNLLSQDSCNSNYGNVAFCTCDILVLAELSCIKILISYTTWNLSSQSRKLYSLNVQIFMSFGSEQMGFNHNMITIGRRHSKAKISTLWITITFGCKAIQNTGKTIQN